jgi:signal transduction histidine kinase
MEDTSRQHTSPHVDASSETHAPGEVNGSVPTSVDSQDRAIELLTSHDAKLRDLAHYLHDEIGQLLVSSSMHLHASLESEPISPHLTTCLTIVQQAIERLRELTSRLHPSILEHLSLPEALRCSLEDRGRRDHVTIEFSAPDFWLPLPPTTAVTGYLAVMQAAEYAISQRFADRIHVILRQDAETIDFIIRDTGPRPMSEPLSSSRDRSDCDSWNEVCQRIEWLGGKWHLESTTRQSETVCVCLPIPLDITKVSGNDVSEEPK